jgi:hypothetical protein
VQTSTRDRASVAEIDHEKVRSVTRRDTASPDRTRASSNGTIVSTPGMPLGARANGRSFSAARCGAWSLATIGTRPAANSAQRAARSNSLRRGGFTLKRASCVVRARSSK